MHINGAAFVPSNRRFWSGKAKIKAGTRGYYSKNATFANRN